MTMLSGESWPPREELPFQGDDQMFSRTGKHDKDLRRIPLVAALAF